MQLLASYLAGKWSPGSGAKQSLVNPATEEVLAEVHAGGHDLAAAFQYARSAGAGELAALTFAQRGALLGLFGDEIEKVLASWNAEKILEAPVNARVEIEFNDVKLKLSRTRRLPRKG